ncbi:helix-turn-helix domain-containing protein [Mycolicibacterium komossense]|uniref:Helix-turn-helix domain-containing protein n=1 Tax=Mycolicibacterium komossense TaxID=1779 RepID=A0ABT3CCS2_9MYCO|nr:helix-turn-helix transcriptional regulator [Mycolicibacterium komossense]MCV7227295.1 helix-turn-helix domain-containing protein [Mycolicibacterium komossense]
MADKQNHLGEYLRARRSLVTPDQAGIPQHRGRRVAGLRREEVALLAGISADYYLRLERGRDRNPSVQVLQSLARVLQLDDENLSYLLDLATEKPRRKPRSRKETVPSGIVKLLPTLAQPAFVEGRYFDILAGNAAATALSPRLVLGRNQMLDIFLDPAEIALYPDWDGITACLIANLRHSIGSDIEDARFIELVGELSLASPRFRSVWSRHDVRPPQGAPTRFEHPQVGELQLNRERLAIGGTDGVHLIVYHADAGSSDADKLALLIASALPSAGQLDKLHPMDARGAPPSDR